MGIGLSSNELAGHCQVNSKWLEINSYRVSSESMSRI